jgi:hypothetical protein
MIPKVNSFYYYYYSSDFNNPDNRHSFIQLIAQTEAFHIDETASQERLTMFTRNHQLCQLLFQSEWDSRNGDIRYLITFKDYEQLKAHLTILSDLLKDFNATDIIETINSSLQFYFEKQGQFKLLREIAEDDPEWEKVVEALESGYTFNYAGKGIERITNYILDNPDHFCVDQNGQPLEKQFTGQLETHYASGNLQKRYAFVNGRVYGECMEYDFDGNKQTQYFYKSFREKQLIRKWDKNGNQIEGN